MSSKNEKEVPTEVVEPAVIVDQAMAKADWQQNMKTVSQRDMFLLDHEMFFDCNFSVGEGEEMEKISSHRLYLAKTSPYFSAMFYGPMKKKGNAAIKIPDVSPKIFKILLEYVYSGTMKLTDFDTAWDVLVAAKTYLFPNSLLRHVRSYLWNHIYPGLMWETVKLADGYDEPELLSTAWKIISEKTSDALEDDNFVDISMSVLQTLVMKDSLTCTEVELFNACLRWANSEAVRQGMDPEPANLRTILEPVIPHIRVLAMSSKDIVEKVRISGIFTKDELYPVITNIVVQDAEVIPEIVCSTPTSRSEPSRDNFFVFGTPRSTLKIARGDTFDEQHTNNCFVSAKANFLSSFRILGIEVPSQVKELKPGQRDSYIENLTVVVIDS